MPQPTTCSRARKPPMPPRPAHSLRVNRGRRLPGEPAVPEAADGVVVAVVVVAVDVLIPANLTTVATLWQQRFACRYFTNSFRHPTISGIADESVDAVAFGAPDVASPP